MRSLVIFLCLAATAAATPLFHCRRDGPLTVASSLEDFRLTTTRTGHSTYSSGLTCEFNAESPNAAFLVEVESFEVSSAVLSISSGDQLLFRGSSVQKHQTSIVTPSKWLRVRFDAAGDRSNSGGVTMRVRALDVNGCPPGWTYLQGNCFGTSSTSGRLDFFGAQRACNNMRANLLQLPSYFYRQIETLMRALPSELSNYFSWIGMTDRDYQYSLYWLDGSRQYSTSDISCISGGSQRSCYNYERCATWIRSRFYTVYMENCYKNKNYVCSSPPGGTYTYYRVPSLGDGGRYVYNSYSWIWGAAVGGLFILGFIIVGTVVAVRNSQVRRNRVSGPVTHGTTACPPPGTYPTQPQPQRWAGPPPPPSYYSATSRQTNIGHEN